MDTVIFTLYNYASNQREEYLLLKLFKTALEEEIKYVYKHICKKYRWIGYFVSGGFLWFTKIILKLFLYVIYTY